MFFSIRRLSVALAIAACGETLPAADSDDGGTGADAGSDSAVGNDAGDAATRGIVVTKDVIEPWHLAVAGEHLVVTSHAATKAGVFRVAKSGGSADALALRPAHGVAVRNGNDVWFCNASDAGGPGLVQVPLDGGVSMPRWSEPCVDVAVEAQGFIAFTRTSTNTAERFDEDSGTLVFLGDGGGPEGIATNVAGVYFAARKDNAIGLWQYGAGTGTLVSTGPGPTRVRADNDFVYWVESETNKVRRSIAKPPGIAEDVATGPDKIGEGGLAIDDTDVYWIVSHGPSAGLYRAPKAGAGTTTPLATGLAFPVDVALDAENAYVTVHDSNEVLRFPKK